MRYALLLLVAACSKPAAVSEPKIAGSPKLNRLMNEQVNPAFSKLSFLVFHAETMDDPEAARAELAATAKHFAAATAVLRDWPDPPVTSQEGKEVFHTYSASVHRYASQLVTSVAADDTAASARALEQIAQTCNNCHHFFRLNIKDSVVGPQAKNADHSP